MTFAAFFFLLLYLICFLVFSRETLSRLSKRCHFVGVNAKRNAGLDVYFLLQLTASLKQPC